VVWRIACARLERAGMKLRPHDVASHPYPHSTAGSGVLFAFAGSGSACWLG
jgi:hypothetical protein